MADFEKRPELQGILKKELLPRHVGIIMDGNGRWAQSRGMPRSFGHKAGVERLRSVLTLTDDLGIEALSVYAFSTENWKRPVEEVNVLMRLLIEFMHKEIDELAKKNVRLRFMGDIGAMSPAVLEALQTALKKTSGNSGLIFNIALNYGGRDEILRAARNLAAQAAEGKINPGEPENFEKLFEQQLYTAGLPPLDLVIRTSGEQRLSNFMLYQAAYAEMVFTKAHWPDFDDDQYIAALQEYQSRSRRFGGV